MGGWATAGKGLPLCGSLARVYTDTNPFIPCKAAPDTGTEDPSKNKTDTGSCPCGTDTSVRQMTSTSKIQGVRYSWRRK